MATTILPIAQRVVADVRSRPSPRLLAWFLGFLAFLAAGVGLATMVMGMMLGAAFVVPLGIAPLWASAVIWRASLIASRTAAGGALVAGPRGVWFAGRLIEAGELRFSPVTVRLGGVNTTVAWAHRPGIRPTPPMSPWFWMPAPPGPLMFDLSEQEIAQLDAALMAAAGEITKVEFVESYERQVDPTVREGWPPADRVLVDVVWGRRRTTLAIDTAVPRETLILVGDPVVDPWRVQADVAAPGMRNIRRMIIEPSSRIVAPVSVWGPEI